MRFLADENIPGNIVDSLRRAGHDVRWIRTDAPGCSDLDVLNLARRDQRVILTFDKDFGQLVFSLNWLALEPGAPMVTGVILFRFQMCAPDIMLNQVMAVIQSRTDWEGHFSVIDEAGIRMRPYPLSNIS